VFIVKHGVVIMTNYAAMRDLTDALTNPAKDELTEVQLDDVTGGKLGNFEIQRLMSNYNEASTSR